MFGMLGIKHRRAAHRAVAREVGVGFSLSQDGTLARIEQDLNRETGRCRKKVIKADGYGRERCRGTTNRSVSARKTAEKCSSTYPRSQALRLS
jgi:hypothetical protein